MTGLDEIDRAILNILQESDKDDISYRKLGEKVGKKFKGRSMAASSIHARVKKMKKAGVIKKIGTIVDPMRVGYNTIALIGLSVDPLKMKEIAKKLAEFEIVQMVGISTGSHDIIVRVLAKDEKSLWRFINEKIKTIEGIRPEMHVSSFLEFYKQTQKIHLNNGE